MKDDRYQTAPKHHEIEINSDQLESSSSSSFKSFDKNIGTQSKGDPNQFSIKRLESRDNVIELNKIEQIYLNNISSEDEDSKQPQF